MSTDDLHVRAGEFVASEVEDLMDKQGRFVSPFSVKRTTEASVADLRKQL